MIFENNLHVKIIKFRIFVRKIMMIKTTGNYTV